MHQDMLQFFSISKVQVLVELSTDVFLLLGINKSSRISMYYVCKFVWNYTHHKKLKMLKSAKGRIIIRIRLSAWFLI